MEQQIVSKEVFGLRFSEILAASTETTYTLAEKLSLNPGTISRYANGLMAPKIPTLYMIANIFGVNPIWLMGYSAPKLLDITENRVPYNFQTEKKPAPVSESRLPEDVRAVALAYAQATPKEQQTVRLVLSDYLQGVTEPKVLAARTTGEPIKDDPSTFIIEGEDPDIP